MTNHRARERQRMAKRLIDEAYDGREFVPTLELIGHFEQLQKVTPEVSLKGEAITRVLVSLCELYVKETGEFPPSIAIKVKPIIESFERYRDAITDEERSAIVEQARRRLTAH